MERLKPLHFKHFYVYNAHGIDYFPHTFLPFLNLYLLPTASDSHGNASAEYHCVQYSLSRHNFVFQIPLKKDSMENHVLIFIDKIVPVYNSQTNFDLHSYTYHRHLESNADQHYPQQWHTVLCIKSSMQSFNSKFTFLHRLASLEKRKN